MGTNIRKPTERLKISGHSMAVTQNQLRHPEQVVDMIHFVKNGGKFKDIEISSIYDKDTMEYDYFVHNGHHRCVSLLLAGRTFLYPEEFYIKIWKPEDYNEINWANKYVTPFDIYSEVRIEDLGPFKNKVFSMSETMDLKDVENWIWANKSLYAEDKVHRNLEEFTNNYLRTSLLQEHLDMTRRLAIYEAT